MRRDDRRRRSQERCEHVGRIDAALMGGAQDGGEDLLRVGRTPRAIAAATHFPRDHRRPEGLSRWASARARKPARLEVSRPTQRNVDGQDAPRIAINAEAFVVHGRILSGRAVRRCFRCSLEPMG